MTSETLTPDEIFGISSFQQMQAYAGELRMPKNFMEHAFERSMLEAMTEFECPLDAVKQFRRKSQEGNEAEYHLGTAHYLGCGAPQDYSLAFQHFMKAAAGGHITALTCLSYMSYYGLGVEKDPNLAYLWAAVAEQRGVDYAPALKASIGKQIAPEDVIALDKHVSCETPISLRGKN